MIPQNFSEYFKSLDEVGRQEIVNELILLISSPSDDTITMLGSTNAKKINLLS